MSKIAVVYWSGTGNTEAMANFVAEGATDAGTEAEVISCADFSADKAASYDAIAFGCPAMGSEELEYDEFQPMPTRRASTSSIPSFATMRPTMRARRPARLWERSWHKPPIDTTDATQTGSGSS